MKVLEPEMIFPGEEIVLVTGYHWIYVLKSFLPFTLIIVLGTFAWALMPTRVTSLVIMIALIASIVWIVKKILDTVVKRCYITNRRLINRSGWTQRDTQDVTLDRIGGIFLDQTPLERFLGYGRVRLIVPVIVIPLPEYLRNPIAFRNALYLKPVAKAPEKPDDDVMEGAEHDRAAKEEDDRFGAFKELREATEELEGQDLGENLGSDLGEDLGEDFGAEDAGSGDSSYAESGADTADTGGDEN